MDGRINQLIEDVAQLKKEFGKQAASDHWTAALEATGYQPEDFLDLVLALRSQKAENTRLRYKVQQLEADKGWKPAESGDLWIDRDNNTELLVVAGIRLLVSERFGPGGFVFDLPANVRVFVKED
jgi:hypothetical protein